MSYLDAAAKIIRDFEGERLLAYKCPAGIWTIGVGHTGPDVKEGQMITAAESIKLLYQDMLEADQAIDELVDVPLTENQRAALLSLIFNIGRGAFGNSTLLKLLNAGRYDAAAMQILKWDKSKGNAISGLTRRRLSEKALFLTYQTPGHI